MNEITIPYHLLIPTIICVFALGAIFYFRKRLFAKNKWLWTSVTVFFIVYLLIVGSAAYDDIYYQWDLNRYDLDKDGMFGKEEMTKEQEAAMQRLTSDTGRNFSFITGLIFATFISTIIFIMGKLMQRRKRQ